MSQFFTNEARRAFDALYRRFDMLCVLRAKRAVRYENEKIFLSGRNS